MEKESGLRLNTNTLQMVKQLRFMRLKERFEQQTEWNNTLKQKKHQSKNIFKLHEIRCMKYYMHGINGKRIELLVGWDGRILESNLHHIHLWQQYH